MSVGSQMLLLNNNLQDPEDQAIVRWTDKIVSNDKVIIT